jgi:hypothetical protein
MSKFTLYRRGTLLGTYPGATPDEAWAALVAEEGNRDFDAMAKRYGLTKSGADVQFSGSQRAPDLAHFAAVPVVEEG